MTAAELRSLTTNLGATSPVLFVLKNGGVLDLVELQVIEDVDRQGDHPKIVGPPTLVLRLTPRPKAEEVNGTAPPVVPVKSIKLPTGPGY